MNGQYIERIEIDSLWNGHKHIRWDLQPGVNILSGVNGVGKSTILNRCIKHLLDIDKDARKNDGVHLQFFPKEAKSVDFEVIRSFDRPVLSSDVLNKFTENQMQTELDLHIYHLGRKWLDYQVNLSNRMVELFASKDPKAATKVQELANEKTHFQDVVDELFRETGKTIKRDQNELYFDSYGESISAYKLSSGEKQMLIILLTVLVQNKKPFVLFMDEPEVSLHVEWQQRLLELLMDLNPNVQVILTTHSPAVIMNGWSDRVTDVEDIEVEKGEKVKK
ncbi:MAG: AAA family ATPase [Bacteroidaceae bacterium]|nr:AAA family ATPase [Bacteroidaceae bacterium]